MTAPRLALFLGNLGRRAIYLVAILLVLLPGCQPTEPPPLTVDMPLHLEEHLDAATILGSEVPADLPQPVEWRFDESQPGWKATPPRPFPPAIRPATVSQTDDALQISLGPSNASQSGSLVGGAYVDVPEWDHKDWGKVVIRARSSGPGEMTLGFNVDPDAAWKGSSPDASPYEMEGVATPLVGDSTVQTYQLPLEPRRRWGEPVEQLGFWAWADGPLEVEILSITVLPMEALYAEEPAGTRYTERGNRYRRSLFVHTPAQLDYRVRIPQGGRLDTGLGILWSEPPTTFQVRVMPDGGQAETLLEETYSDRASWAQRSVDLSAYSGQVVTLSLEAESDRDGSVALWGAPTLTGPRTTDKPNVIFYIIDGAGAEYMSLYGYNRRTTPNIDRLAAEGAVFEYAYSNSTWTKPSTPSFMTSLHHAVLGGYSEETDPLPDQAVTMAEHLHEAGYQTAVFVSNAFAGTISSLERGVDVLREAGTDPNSISSRDLHEEFWQWRETFPAEPYWVHFQTTDVHWPWKPVAPFAGLYVTPERRQRYYEWEQQVGQALGFSSPTWPHPRTAPELFEEIGISRPAFYSVGRDLYDETMAHNDHQLGRLVERLKATGEWQHTLLIVAADHGTKSIAGLLEPMPERWGASYFSYTHRVPMIIVWPERIAAGQRFSGPVSMIDMLPTVLDLVGLPAPEVLQGRSLAPVLLGQEGWEPRPVIFEEVEVDGETRELTGHIAVMDGRWVAWLGINLPLQSEGLTPEQQRPLVRLYDLWTNPHYGGSVHEENPDLVEKYTVFLEAQFEAHQALGQLFTPSEPVPLTPEQLEMLRTLGYIR